MCYESVSVFNCFGFSSGFKQFITMILPDNETIINTEKVKHINQGSRNDPVLPCLFIIYLIDADH